MKRTILRKAVVRGTQTTNTKMTLSPVGDTTAIHAKLAVDVKNKIDELALSMNVPQWVIINNLCTTGLESLGK
jgi:hypothetical protein